MTARDIAEIRAQVLAAARLRESYHHGERHWRAVAHAGLLLAPQVEGCDALAVLLFALFHDAMRENEYSDPEHGLRGGELARRLLAGRLDESSVQLLYEACRDHTHVTTSHVPTVGVCWDADRLNLWRVGTRPDACFLSTGPARDPGLIHRAAAFHDADHDWGSMTEHALALARG